MIISKDEPHAPEIEATEEGRNAIYFQTDSEEALAASLVKTMRDREEWLGKADAILRDCMDRYSVDVMASRLAKAFEYRVAK